MYVNPELLTDLPPRFLIRREVESALQKGRAMKRLYTDRGPDRSCLEGSGRLHADARKKAVKRDAEVGAALDSAAPEIPA